MSNKPDVFTTAPCVNTVAIIGGGLAGLAAALEAKRRGKQVILFERSRFLGGRAASIALTLAKNSSQLVDNGQHLFLGCCRQLRQLNDALGVTDCFDTSDQITFLLTNGKRWSLKGSRWLPIAWRYLPSLCKIPFFSWSKRWNIIRISRKLLKIPFSSSEHQATFLEWLHQQGADSETIQFFWNPLIISALAELPDFVSLGAASQMVKELFGTSHDSMTIFIPNRPLREIYHQRALQSLQKAGIDVQFLKRVQRIHLVNNRPVALEFSQGERVDVDEVIVATGAFAAVGLLGDSSLTNELDRVHFDRFELGTITAIHLWLDQSLTDEKGVVLPDGPGQWLFCPRNQKAFSGTQKGVYHQVVISASHRLLEGEELTVRKQNLLIERIIEQLRQTFPRGITMKVLYSKVSTVLDAVVSPSPAVWADRLDQKTSIDHLAIAGDWTQTGWTSTMEGAVRSGIAAVDALDR